MPKMTDDQLLSIVKQEFSTAMGADGGDIAAERARAWAFYLSKPIGNEVEGESEVVTSDVADVVDSIMPSLLRLFTTADNLLNFEPVDAGDVSKAEQESDYVNYVFFKQNPAFMVLYTWFFDALTQKNGIVKAWWDDSEVVSTESYSGLSIEEVVDLMEDPELEALERDERFQETVDENGQILASAKVYDIKFRRVSKAGRVRIENVPPDQYRISSDARTLDPSEARMVGQEREVKRSELLDMGFDAAIVDSLPSIGEESGSTERKTRLDKSDDTQGMARDRSQDLILLREAFIKVDYDGDGRSELRQVFTASDQVLSNEDADRQMFHVISPQPLPHKHFGRCPAEKVMDIQVTNSVLLRQILMNLYHTNNPGHGVWEQAMGDNTLDDLLTTKVGAVRRFTRPVSEAYAPMTVPFTAAATFPMLEYFEKAKKDRTGIHSDAEGTDPTALKHVQQSALSQKIDQSSMKIEAIARICAETGIKGLFLHIHELLLKNQKKAQVARLRNGFVQVNPQEWRTRRDMTVTIGLGLGTRESNLMHLRAIGEVQQWMALNGGMNLTVSPRNMYNTAAEIVKNSNRKQPELFFKDPGDQAAPPPDSEQQQLQRQQQELIQRQQQLDAQKQQQAQAKLQLQAQEQQQRHQREMAEIQRKMEADKNDFIAAMEKVSNQITELELKYNAQLPGGGA